MAKCVQVVGQGVPVRCTDAEAREIVVKDHDGEYCSKSVWKEWWARAEMPRATRIGR